MNAKNLGAMAAHWIHRFSNPGKGWKYWKRIILRVSQDAAQLIDPASGFTPISEAEVDEMKQSFVNFGSRGRYGEMSVLLLAKLAAHGMPQEILEGARESLAEQERGRSMGPPELSERVYDAEGQWVLRETVILPAEVALMPFSEFAAGLAAQVQQIPWKYPYVKTLGDLLERTPSELLTGIDKFGKKTLAKIEARLAVIGAEHDVVLKLSVRVEVGAGEAVDRELVLVEA